MLYDYVILYMYTHIHTHRHAHIHTDQSYLSIDAKIPKIKTNQ